MERKRRVLLGVGLAASLATACGTLVDEGYRTQPVAEFKGQLRPGPSGSVPQGPVSMAIFWTRELGGGPAPGSAAGTGTQHNDAGVAFISNDPAFFTNPDGTSA